MLLLASIHFLKWNTLLLKCRETHASRRKNHKIYTSIYFVGSSHGCRKVFLSLFYQILQLSNPTSQLSSPNSHLLNSHQMFHLRLVNRKKDAYKTSFPSIGIFFVLLGDTLSPIHTYIITYT